MSLTGPMKVRLWILVTVGACLIAPMVSGCAQLQTLVNGQTVSETVTQQYSASTSPNIVLNTSNGSIDVSASDSNTVKIEAEKRAQSAADLSR
jgi:hypothetical protein